MWKINPQLCCHMMKIRWWLPWLAQDVKLLRLLWPKFIEVIGPGHNYRWNKRTCGVICFVKDNLRRSYFIRVYDMDRTVLVFDQEIYNQFRLDCDCSQHPTE